MFWIPARQRGTETLDDPSSNPALAERSLRDVALTNRWFGGQRAIVREIRRTLAAHPTGVSLCVLDIGTGLGDIPDAVQRLVASSATRVQTIGVEVAPALARAARARCTFVTAADAMTLPFADASIDIVTCSQLLHHFPDDAAVLLLRECARVTRQAVIVGDLRRSWCAVAGLWICSFALGFHPVSRHDGIISILRGYTKHDLGQLMQRAMGSPAAVHHALGWRITATWVHRNRIS